MKNKLWLFIPLLVSSGSYPSVSFDSFTYSNEDKISENIYDFKNADNVLLDGIKEDVYSDEVFRLYHNNDDSLACYVSSYFYFGKEGVHTFLSVKDDIINFNSKRAVYYNSSIEMFLTDINKTSIDSHSVQYRISAGGTFSKLVGIKSKSSWTASYFEGDFAVKVNGELFTKGADGFDVEVFIPWKELGFSSLDQVEGLSFYLAYNRVHTTSKDENLKMRNRTTKLLSYQATPATWVPIKKSDNTVKNVTPEGINFGSSNNYSSTYGFDFSKDENKEVKLNSYSSASYAFVKDFYDNNYYFETYIDSLGGSNSPKIGIFTFYMGNRIVLYIKKNDKNRCGVVQRNLSNSNWNWNIVENDPYSPCTNESFKNDSEDYSSGVKLAMYRNKDVLCFFVNDELYFSTQEFNLGEKTFTPKAIFKAHDIQSVEGFYESNYIGLYSNYATARFTNYQVLKGEQANNKVLELGGIL